MPKERLHSSETALFKQPLYVAPSPIFEVRYYDKPSATYVCDTTGTVSVLDQFNPGAIEASHPYSWRDVSLFLRGCVRSGSATTNADFLIAVVWDQQPNKSLASRADIFDASMLPNVTNKHRFRVIRYWYGSLIGESDTTIGGDDTVYSIDAAIKLPGTCICRGSNTGAAPFIGARITGALLLVTMGNCVPGVTAPIATLTGRCFFISHGT